MEKNSSPLVSICVPNYNGELFLKKTLQSILDQTYKNIEILFLDNDSSDKSVSIANLLAKNDKRLSIHKNAKNKGYAKNVNRGIKLAKGKYVCVFHADDIYTPTIIEEQVSFLEKNNACGGVFTLAKTINSEDKIVGKVCLPFTHSDKIFIGGKEIVFPLMLQHGNFFICPSAMVRKAVYNDIGLYTEERLVIEDQDMWLRILTKYELSILKKPLLHYRLHEKQGSMTLNNMREDLSLEYVLYDEYIAKGLASVSEKVLDKYYIMKSKGYLFCAVGALLNKSYDKLRFNLNESKKLHPFSLFTIYGIIQFVLAIPLYPITRIKIIVLIRILKLLGLKRKLPFLNFI